MLCAGPSISCITPTGVDSPTSGIRALYLEGFVIFITYHSPVDLCYRKAATFIYNGGCNYDDSRRVNDEYLVSRVNVTYFKQLSISGFD